MINRITINNNNNNNNNINNKYIHLGDKPKIPSASCVLNNSNNIIDNNIYLFLLNDNRMDT